MVHHLVLAWLLTFLSDARMTLDEDADRALACCVKTCASRDPDPRPTLPPERAHALAPMQQPLRPWRLTFDGPAVSPFDWDVSDPP